MKGTRQMKYAAVSLAFFLASCGPFVPVDDLTGVNPANLEAAREIPIFEVGNPPEAEHTAIQIIEAWSCKNVLWDPPATQDDALLKLKYKAFQLDADAIKEVSYATPGEHPLSTNCWEFFRAGGIAIRFD